MKTKLLLLFVLSVNAFGETLPPDAEALRAKRDAKIAEINQLYATALEKLMKKAMAEGNLETAKVLEAEIAKATPDPFFKPEEKYDNTVWAWGSGGEVSFSKGGRMTHSRWSGGGKWKMVGKEILITSPAGKDFKVLFQEDGTGIVTDPGGASTTLKKIN